MIPSIELVTGPAWEHIWQSTLFALLAALLAVLLKDERAHIRFGVWLAASVKFLVPFSLLVSAGHRFSIGRVEAAPIVTSTLMDSSSQPFSDPTRRIELVTGGVAASETPFDIIQALSAIWLAGAVIVFCFWIVRWLQARAVVRSASLSAGPRVSHILARLERTTEAEANVILVASSAPIEPAVFGILRPVLLWPRQLTGRLRDDQIAAILEHELAHVRRRDNLSAAIHATVQAIFWFHPLVWWVGRRLVEERERACDEAVLSRGSSPQVYAESILQTCWRSVQLRGACLARAAGSNLAERIQRIMCYGSYGSHGTGEPGRSRTLPKRWIKRLVLAAGVVSVTAPIVVGLLTPRVVAAQGSTFASSLTPRRLVRSWDVTLSSSDRLTFLGFTGRDLVRYAYGLESTPVVDGPEWLDAESMTIEAAVAATDVPTSRAALQTIFERQFGVRVHRETRNLPVLALVVAGALGPQLRQAADCFDFETVRATGLPQAGPGGQVIRFCGGVDDGPFGYTFTGATMAQIASVFRGPAVNQRVVDATGLDGRFDGQLSIVLPLLFLRNRLADGWPGLELPGLPSLSTAMREQLGLALEEATMATDVLVIDQMVRP